jgi:transcriptional regulator with XRE-family HTH domain
MPITGLRAEWGRRLASAREAKGLSIGELARRTGVHKSHLARFELGEAGLGDEYRIRVAAEIGQRVEELFPYPDTSTCPSAPSATAEESSAGKATDGQTNPPRRTSRPPAPSVAAQDGSGHEESPGNE